MSICKEEWEETRGGAQSEDRVEQLIDRREISSFIISLQSPEGVMTNTLKALCA
jgi:prenyltransferase beta subunit